MYIPNEAKLDSTTTQKDNYKAWENIVPPKRRQQPKWVSTTGKFLGDSTTKSDFIEMAIPAKFVRKQQVYLKTDDKMDGVSTQVSDYKPWEVKGVPVRRKTTQAKPSSPEDRYFNNN
jgi:hypothetical protein